MVLGDVLDILRRHIRTFWQPGRDSGENKGEMRSGLGDRNQGGRKSLGIWDEDCGQEPTVRGASGRTLAWSELCFGLIL